MKGIRLRPLLNTTKSTEEGSLTTRKGEEIREKEEGAEV